MKPTSRRASSCGSWESEAVACQHDSVDDWMKALLQYGSGPIIAAGALLWQQARTDNREAKRATQEVEEREKDRNHQREMAEAERRQRINELAATFKQGQDLADAERAARMEEMRETLNHERETREAERAAENASTWRSERRTLYANFLARQEDVAARLVTALYGSNVDFGTSKFLQNPDAERAISEDLENALEREVAEIKLFGSKAAGVAASSMVASAISASREAYWATKDPSSTTWTRQAGIAKEGAYEDAADKFLAAVRHDLGVDT